MSGAMCFTATSSPATTPWNPQISPNLPSATAAHHRSTLQRPPDGGTVQAVLIVIRAPRSADAKAVPRP